MESLTFLKANYVAMWSPFWDCVRRARDQEALVRDASRIPGPPAPMETHVLLQSRLGAQVHSANCSVCVFARLLLAFIVSLIARSCPISRIGEEVVDLRSELASHKRKAVQLGSHEELEICEGELALPKALHESQAGCFSCVRLRLA